MTSRKKSAVETSSLVKKVDVNDRIISLVSTLYQHHIFQEFRLPVLVQYPNLCESYLKKVQSPMDLGTLLSRALQHQLTVEELREGLQRMIANALLFNKDYSQYIISMTKHLETMALGLFEEMFHLPYHLASQPKAAGVNSSPLDSAILQRRKRRYELVEQVSLNEKELQALSNALQEFKAYTGSVPALLSVIEQLNKTLAQARQQCRDRTMAVRSNRPVGEDNPLHFTLKDLIEPLIDKICAREVTITSSSASSAIGIDHIPLVTTYYLTKVRAATSKIEGRLALLQQLDHLLGIVLVHIEERVYRGFTYSNCWNIPYPQCIWSQIQNDARHRNQWWPGMILISNSEQYPMSLAIMEKNLERLPKSYWRDLIKFRPKPTPITNGSSAATTNGELDFSKDGSAMDVVVDQVDSKTSSNAKTTANGNSGPAPSATTVTTKTSIDCPEGYLLVEYFGAHDLGWVHADATMPMPESGEMPKFPKVCAMDVFREGEEARLVLERFHRSFGTCVALPKLTDSEGVDLDVDDLAEIPPLSELQEMIRYSPELQQAMQEFEAQQKAMKEQQQQSRENSLVVESSGVTKRKEAISNHRDSNTNSEEAIDTAMPSNKSSSARKKAFSGTKTPSSDKKSSSRTAVKNTEHRMETSDVEDNHSNQEEAEGEDEDREDQITARSSRMNARARTMKGKSSTTSEILDNRGNNLTHVAAPSKLRPIDFKVTLLEKAILNGKFYVSKCSNPSFIIPTSNGSEILPGFYSRKGINYRRNAVFKTRAFTHWLHKMKPLLITESITAFPMTMSGAINPTIKTSSSSNTLARDGEPQTHLNPDLIAFSSKKKNQSIRNYQNPIAPTYEELSLIPTSEFFQNIHDTLLEQGCTRFYIGKGIFHTRIVDLNHRLFHREDQDLEKRREKLLKEMATIKYMTAKLKANEEYSEASEGESDLEERKNEKKKKGIEGMFSEDEDIFGLNYGSSDEEKEELMEVVNERDQEDEGYFKKEG